MVELGLGTYLMETSSQAEAILERLPIGDYTKDAEPTLLITSDQV